MGISGIELTLKGMLGSTEKIQSLEEIKQTIPSQSTKMTGIDLSIFYNIDKGPKMKRHQSRVMGFLPRERETGGGVTLKTVAPTFDKN